MELLPTLLRTCLSARVTAAAAVAVAGVGSVHLTEKRSRWPRAERITVPFEADLVGVTVKPRPTLQLVAICDRAPTAPGHFGTGSPHDLSNPLARYPETGSDTRECFSGLIATQHLRVSLRKQFVPSRVRGSSCVVHASTRAPGPSYDELRLSPWHLLGRSGGVGDAPVVAAVPHPASHRGNRRPNDDLSRHSVHRYLPNATSSSKLPWYRTQRALAPRRWAAGLGICPRSAFDGSIHLDCLLRPGSHSLPARESLL